MTVPRKNNRLKLLNKYSWTLLIAFVFATLSMLYHNANISFKDFFQTLPLIVIAIYYSEKLAPLLSRPDQNLKKSELFTRDLFILTFSFLFACLLSLILSYNNSDVKGWWALIVYFITLYGFLFSILFSAVAVVMEQHKIYTIVFSFLIIILISMGKFFPHYLFIPIIGNIDTFYVATCSLLVFHCLVIITYKIVRLFQCKGKNIPQQ